MKTWTLKRTVQCSNCPWKVSSDTHKIPHGYSEESHCALIRTIAEPGQIRVSPKIQVMACHHSKPDKPEHCVGWLHNQIGPGNNIQLRLKMLSCENAENIRVKGQQHEHFEDTLPWNKKDNNG